MPYEMDKKLATARRRAPEWLRNLPDTGPVLRRPDDSPPMRERSLCLEAIFFRAVLGSVSVPDERGDPPSSSRPTIPCAWQEVRPCSA
jgi:hypothetical protein